MNGRYLIQSNSFIIPLADSSVNMVATSWPYFGLRAYDGEPIIIGGDPDCRHEWQTNKKKRGGGGEREYGSYDGGVGCGPAVKLSESATCRHCKAWRGCFGNETLHDCMAWARGERPCWYCYVCHGRMLAAETWRVLHPTGTFWLNLGDSFASGQGGKQGKTSQRNGRANVEEQMRGPVPAGLKSKDLIGIPWRVALALQADGWYLRRDIIWDKPNAMPESVTDRCTSSHEYIFMLAKRERYFYDRHAIAEPVKVSSIARATRAVSDGHKNINGAPGQPAHTMNQPRPNWAYGGNKAFDIETRRDAGRECELTTTANKRSVWRVATVNYKGAHYACWPPELVETMILAGSSEHGICPHCRSPWRRITHKGKPEQRPDNANPVLPYTAASGLTNGLGATTLHMVREVETIGWQPTCKCPEHTPIPSVILDPFAGSGTTVMVAKQLGRVGIGLDLSFAYLSEQGKERTGIAAEERFTNGIVDKRNYAAELPLFALSGTAEKI